MRAILLKEIGKPLSIESVTKPTPQERELLVQVHACGVCKTDLHIKEGDLPTPKLPLILGHEIVGTVEAIGRGVKEFKKGDLVGIAWLGFTCGACEFCKNGKENLCDRAQFTGYHLPGGFAEYTTCREDFAIRLPEVLPYAEMAPLLCSGLIGYRAYRKAAPERSLGLYGFGASAHLLTQLALFEKKEVYAFTRKGDQEGQEFAKELGAFWAGDSTQKPPVPLDAAILFAPVGELVPQALKALKKGGRCITAEIHMSDIPSFPYKDLWGEKRIESVANLTRKDALEFFPLAAQCKIRPKITTYPLEKANEALQKLKEGGHTGAFVLVNEIKN